MAFLKSRPNNLSAYSIGRYVEVEPGVELYYEDQGSGEPIVFVPGWTFTTEMFVHQKMHFSKTNRVITFDPRSQGRSSASQHGNDYITHSNDLAKLIIHLHLNNIVIVGWSFGCLTAWGYIKFHGIASLKGLVTIDISPKPLSTNPQDWVEGGLDDIADIYSTSLRSRKGMRELVYSLAKEVLVQRELTHKEINWIIDQSLKTSPEVAAALFASGMFANRMAEAKIAHESLPSLCIIAEHWAQQATSFMTKHFPKTKTTVLGGHMMFWEYPDSFNTLLENFISSIS